MNFFISLVKVVFMNCLKNGLNKLVIFHFLKSQKRFLTTKYWVEDKGTSSGKPSGAPYIQTIKSFLISKTNLTEQEVLNRPFAQAVWDMTTCLEIDGTLKINSKEDDEAAEEAKRFETYFEGLTEEEKNKMRGIPANN